MEVAQVVKHHAIPVYLWVDVYRVYQVNFIITLHASLLQTVPTEHMPILPPWYAKLACLHAKHAFRLSQTAPHAKQDTFFITTTVL